ncbi:MAG TPA: hypothetical protein PLA27_01180 [Anaerolineales bacterium]|jgi:hypothetical protein|nr:hypothetical protein [Anaerolineales bacterium]
MKVPFRKIESLAEPRYAPWLFLIVAFFAYGLLFWRHGFYWDDLPMTWIRYELGRDAMAKYFSTARPVWAVLYQATTTFLPPAPAAWQIFSILWRWLSVVLLWQLVRELWRDREKMAALAGLLFLLYPGFNLQFASFLTAHFWIVVCFLFASWLLTLRAINTPSRYWLFTSLAMILSALNLWMLEYFYSLELARAAIIFYALRQGGREEKIVQTAWRAFLHWLPYLLVFLANILYRVFVFTNVAYQNVFFSELRSSPFQAILGLIKNIAADIWLASAQAFGAIFIFPNAALDGPLTTLMYLAVVIVVGALVFIFFKNADAQTEKRSAYWAIGIGLIAMLLGGGPYWLASLDISLSFPASRFTMSFMFGASLLIAGLFELIPIKLRVVFVATIVALSAGRQVTIGDSFLRDWQSQKNLFWQMRWRAPALQPDTLALMNEQLVYYADNSISAGLNWIYDPNASADDIQYVIFYPSNRLNGSLVSLEPNTPIRYSYIAGEFHGNTSDALAFYYAPPYCLRLLDSDLDKNNRFIPDDSLMRQAATLSNPQRILREPPASMPAFYGAEPPHGWCYYFQKAELARQFGDWDEVNRLADAAFKLDEHFNNPVELFVFIEGYAHAGDWDDAIRLSNEARQVSKSYVDPLLCKLWKRIEAETTPSEERTEALNEIFELTGCEK